MSSGAAQQRAGSNAGRVLRTIETGSSGATVRIVKYLDGSLIAIKTASDPRVPAAKQKEAREAILPLFADRLPDVLFAGPHRGHDVLVTECPSALTFADEAANQGPTPALVETWRDIAATLAGAWMASAQPGYCPERATRNHLRRLQRAVAGLRFASRTLRVPLLAPQRISVNGTAYGAWYTAYDLLAAVLPPTVRVACHGDPQPANILIDASRRWYLVDWEWSGLHHDWRMMISHLVGWWYVNDILSGSRGSVVVTSAGLELAYDQPDIRSIEPWVRPIADAFDTMSEAHRRDCDLTAVALHTALLLLREIPRTAARDARHLLAPLFGEAMRLIRSTHDGPLHPLIHSLLASQQGADPSR
jgi:hypothetical protein